MRTLWADIRYGVRMLAANPGFTAVAVLSLAVGIGANTAMFSLADAMLLRPLPVEHPSEMVRLNSTSRPAPFDQLSYPDFVDFRDQNTTLAGIIGSRHFPVGFSSDPNLPAQIQLGLAASTNFFDLLGVKPALGRGFRADEERARVVVLSDFVWASQFGRDPSVIGKNVKLSKLDFTVIGVAPKSFPGLDRYVHESLFVPFGVMPDFAPDDKGPFAHRDKLNVIAYGRLRPGKTAGEAQAELRGIASNLERAYPDTNRGRSVLVMPELEARMKIDPEDAAQSLILLSIAGLVLLIACANVANLLLSRARARSREIAIRLAIGAGRGRLLRQLLTESLLLAFAGGAAGMVLAMFSMNFLGSLRFPTTLPLWLVTKLDVRVLIFCLIASALSGIIFGLTPAWQALKADLSGTLKAGDTTPAGKTRRFQVRDLLVVGQVAMSMLLLLTSGLLVKDFSALNGSRAGFRTDHVLVMTLDPALARYTDAQGRTFYRQLADRAREIPGVRSVALGQHVPLGVTSSLSNIVVEGYQMPRDQKDLLITTNTIDEHYLPLMRIPLLRGRNFDAHDTADSRRVAIINETMAEQYWPRGNALGGRMHKGDQTLEVVGIAKNIKYRDIGEKPMPFLYLPFAQQYQSRMVLHVEAAGDPSSLAAPVLAEIRQMDAGTPVEDVQTLNHFFQEGALFGNRLITQVVTAIGLFGLLLATAGLYGVIAYSVSRRTREIGIRIAIGANPGSVARLILHQGFVLTLIGTGIGLGLTLLASGVLKNLLAGVSARDPWVYLTVPPILAAISMLACYLPARRAARIDPLLALRQD